MLTQRLTIPDTLFYNPSGSNLYIMIHNKSLTGQMVAAPLKTFFGKPELFIYYLGIYKDKRTGLGTKFLNFAKNLSIKSGCEGRMALKARTLPLDPLNPPHQFYRKFGFTTDNKKLLKKIDKSNRQHKELNGWFPEVYMYYPEVQNRNSFIEKIKELF